MIATPLYIILLAWVLSEMRGNFRHAVNMIFVVMLGFSVYNQFTNSDIEAKENYRGAVSYINNFATPRDIVAVSPPYTLFPVQYYYSSTTRLSTLPFWDRRQLNLPAPSAEEIKNTTTKLKDGHRRIFLLSTANLYGADNVKYYMDHNYTRLQVLQFSPNVWLYIYQAEYPVRLSQAN